MDRLNVSARANSISDLSLDLSPQKPVPSKRTQKTQLKQISATLKGGWVQETPLPVHLISVTLPVRVIHLQPQTT
jgi:hypothetical protein